jgi:protein-tyrosine-phosphatase
VQLLLQVRVLFICVANAGRSVMAERIFNAHADGRHSATSAGSEPGAAVHPVVLQALDEIGLDASDHTPSRLDATRIAAADIVVSTCGEEACPVTPPGIRRVYWSFSDPKNLPIEQVRPIRDEIESRVETLLSELA